MHLLAEMLWLGRRHDEARAWFEKTAALRREVLGQRNSRTLSTVTSLAYVLLEQGRFAEAEPMLREALAAPAEDRWTHGLRRSLLGWSLAGQRMLDEAGPLLREGHRELKESAEGRKADELAEVERARRRLALLQ
jgi:eukaryotic-like serine/threonine-protein kinase